MTRTRSERIRDVRRVVEAAREVARARSHIAADLAHTTGLSPEGVELGFTRHLELDADDAQVGALVDHAGDARQVHVVLSANVFVAALRAIAIARAASERVVVRPSRREPHFARALVDACGEPAITRVDDVAWDGLADGEVHVYGRDETIEAIRARVAPGVIVRGHGAGMGIAVVGQGAPLDATARALADDVVAFDQRGCLSPRLVLVEGDMARGEGFTRALDAALTARGRAVPRGLLSDDERADATRWLELMTFAGRTLRGPHHALALSPAGAPPPLPPTGRHLGILAGHLDDLAASVRPLRPWIVACGTDDASRLGSLAPEHARLSAIGAMQRPPLDGPVDRRDPLSPRRRGSG